MFVRTITTRRGTKTYTSHHLVESYRKENGLPAHRVLCSLSHLPEQTIENLRRALQAARAGQGLVLGADLAEAMARFSIAANLRYLDVAVAYRGWQELRLDQLLAELTVERTAEVAPADVIAGLVIHRCVAPGSKLAASQWYPTTALPELQGVAPARFGNSRVHRALSILETVETGLQTRLPEHLRSGQGGFASLFMDVTDTWFEGRGPALAHKAVTKEGLLRQKIGLVLLCDERGYPVRWATLPGSYYEGEVMGSLIEEVAALDWLHKVPLVADRMMGKASSLARMADSGVRFVTALPADEFESWTTVVPWQPFAELVLAGTTASRRQDLHRIQEAATRAKLERVRDDRWLLDLGSSTRVTLGTTAGDTYRPNAHAVRLAAALRADLDSGKVRNVKALALQYRCSANSIRSYLQLTHLTPAVQQRILAGETEKLSFQQLHTLAGQPDEEQPHALDDLLTRATGRRIGRPPVLTLPEAEAVAGTTVRLVVAFNPEAFAEKRQSAADRCRELDAFLADLNRRLRATTGRRRTEASILAEVQGLLRHWKWLELFEIRVTGQATGDWQVELVRNEAAWAKRRRYDGFCVFAAHPDLPVSPAELVELYYAKDKLEKDFQVIKSELELRPVHHRTDAKVRAHVTLCVLALLVERYLQHKLSAHELHCSASTLFERLAPVHLNQLEVGSDLTYTITKLDPEQRSLLRALGFEQLSDDDVMREVIHPRR